MMQYFVQMFWYSYTTTFALIKRLQSKKFQASIRYPSMHGFDTHGFSYQML